MLCYHARMETADSNPLITVIIPVYNAEKYLRRGLDSLLAQTCGNWEAVCIDDGSTDGSAAVLEEYARRDSRFRMLRQENSGVSVARNRGIREARGEWVTFLDADDWFSPELVERLLAETGREEVDIILFEAAVEYAEGTKRNIGQEEALLLKEEGEIVMEPGKVDVSVGSCCGKVYRRSFLTQRGIEFPIGMRQEDEVFYRCAMAVARHVFALQYKGYHYFQNAASYMNTAFNAEESYLLYLRGTEIMLGFYRENRLSREWEATLFHFLFTQLFRWRHTLSWKQLQALRERSKPFLAESGFAETHRGDFRLRFLSPLPARVEMESHGDFYFERHRFMGVTYAKIHYKDFKFACRVTPFSKLRNTARRALRLPGTRPARTEKN